MKAEIIPAGDNALVIMLGNKIEEALNKRIHSIALAIEEAKPEWLIEVVPTYTTICIYYDPILINYEKLKREVKSFLKAKAREKKSRIVDILVAYGKENGPDLEFVARYNNLSIEEVIEIHSKPLYRVYMLGFLPGFAYLGGMDERIATPRLEEPRVKVPAGSIGIAEKQTGFYSIESPGGWRLIGKTPLKLFDQSKEPPTLVLPGDYIKFTPIDKEGFNEFLERN
jgi:KipI family sensor histidine kinase inhibitor